MTTISSPEPGLTLGGTELLGLGGTSDSSSESSERNDLLVVLDVGQVGVGLLEVHTCDTASNREAFRGRSPRLSSLPSSIACLPFKAAATSRMFLKWVERYSPLDFETVWRGKCCVVTARGVPVHKSFVRVEANFQRRASHG